jgi:hypothetical protein
VEVPEETTQPKGQGIPLQLIPYKEGPVEMEPLQAVSQPVGVEAMPQSGLTLIVELEQEEQEEQEQPTVLPVPHFTMPVAVVVVHGILVGQQPEGAA